MATTTRRRRGAHTATAVAALFLLATPGVAHADTTPTDDPVQAAAGWLATALVDGERIQTEFDGVWYDAPGATADTVFGLASAEVAAGSITQATDWLEGQVGAYTGAPDDTYVGATAKLILVAEVTGRDPRGFGGVDLVAQLEAREVTAPDPDDADDLLGRFRDLSGFGDFSTTLTQSLAVLALHRADDTAPSAEAVTLLLDQQCDDGGFRSALGGDTCAGDVDTTGYAVQALAALGETAAVDAAVAWLQGIQGADGGFASSFGEVNANSTGLAAIALTVGGADDAAAAAQAFLVGLQDGCDGEEPGAIVYSATDRGVVAVATAQSLPGLTGRSLADLTAAAATSDVPGLDCPAADPEPEPEPVTDDEAADDTDDAAGLPDTGGPAGALALFGAATIALGTVLLRRSRPGTVA